MGLAYAMVFRDWLMGGRFVTKMAIANTENDGEDALSWYNSNFSSLGMDNSRDGRDTLRHLFVLMYGLGMRESSGKFCEGRDQSADNTSADTAEAGLFQTSYDARYGCPGIETLLDVYKSLSDDPQRLGPTFHEEVSARRRIWLITVVAMGEVSVLPKAVADARGAVLCFGHAHYRRQRRSLGPAASQGS